MNQKEIAIQCLKKLDIYKPYIRKFEKEDMPTFFERCAGYYLFNEPVLQDKVKKFQEEYGSLVYAITHEWLEDMECWSFLCVSKGTESIDDCIMDASRAGTFYVYSYVWNQEHDHFSEFGDIIVQSAGGGLRRLG